VSSIEAIAVVLDDVPSNTIWVNELSGLIFPLGLVDADIVFLEVVKITLGLCEELFLNLLTLSFLFINL